jgi:hypothetical protein
MKEMLLKIVDKLDVLDQRVDNVDKTLAVQAEQLKVHIQRSDQNEILIQDNQKRIAKIEKVSNFFSYGWKVIVGIGIIVGTVGGTLRIFGII